MSEFGFTNDNQEYQRVIHWRDAAVADGWEIRPTYDGHESQERASRLTRNGFTVSILTRVDVGKWKYEAKVNVWGPDGLMIPAGGEYDWPRLQAGLRTCPKCGASNVDTHRFSFAGRACSTCLPDLKREHERPGWDR